MRSEIMCLVINWLLHLFDVLFIVKYLDYHMKCHIHEFYILLLASATLLCAANVTIQNCVYKYIANITLDMQIRT